MRFWRKGKLSLGYIGPFEILRTIGEVAYELTLTPNSVVVHPDFYVFMLRRYILDEFRLLQWNSVQLDEG